jgi:L-aspartate oxidase
VFGSRAAASVAAGRRGATPTGAMAALVGRAGEGVDAPGPALVLDCPSPAGTAAVGLDPAVRAGMGGAMFAGAGLERSGASLAAVADDLDRLADRPGDGSVAALEAANLHTVARALVCAAAGRTESRGTHTRSDHPDTDPAQRRRLVCGGGAGAG